MHDLLTPDAKLRYSEAGFERAYAAAAATATVERLRAHEPSGENDDTATVPIDLRTRVFGVVRGELAVPVKDGKVAWAPNLALPSVRPGEKLTRRSVAPLRAKLLSREGKVIAEGPAGSRASPLGTLAGSISGEVDPQRTASQRQQLYALGFARNQPVGQTGLERAFEADLRGSPGGELRAGRRVLARSQPQRAKNMRTSIDLRLQESAVTALAGRFGGIAALDAKTAEIRALAGVAFSAPQPPGSTFKLITTTAALEAHKVKLNDQFPVQTAATIDGVALENANGESCGGSFADSFAHSCNSVFAPLGVKVGAKGLVDAAQRYGFNGRANVPGELPGTLPKAAEIKSPLEVGSTAIGQGKVLATPLLMASVAQTISQGGVKKVPTLRPGAAAVAPIRVTSRGVARTLTKLMLDVVGYGTGTAAQIPGVKVAGKTGTAELEDTRGPDAQDQPSDTSNTDAWFTSFAPADKPRIVVAVMLVRAGAGGSTAAPAAQQVLLTGLKNR
jgi:cell division protein FtsI/penicillin-binding protein 2